MKKNRNDTINRFARFVSEPKVRFFRRYRADIVMDRRQGIFFRDEDGREFINCHCNGGVFNLGHRNAELVQLLKDSLDSTDIGNHHFISKERADLAEALLRSTCPPGTKPVFHKVAFAVGGGEAADLAIKMARGFTGRRKIVSLIGGYHGHTGLALAAGEERYRDPFLSSDNDFSMIRLNDREAASRALSSNVAAFIMETIPATLGMKMPETAWMAHVRELCEKNGIILIADEIQTGLGRTGTSWAFLETPLKPDMFLTGKGLSGGLYPMAAVVYHGRLASVFEKDPFIHISTFGGAEAGCRVSTRVVEISSSEKFLKNVREQAAFFQMSMERLVKAGKIREFRQKGLFMAIVMEEEVEAFALLRAMMQSGLFAVYANHDRRVIQFLPPLIISRADAEMILSRFHRAISLTGNFSYRILKMVLKVML